MPAVLFLFADSNKDTGWFTGFENSHDLVGLSFAEIGFDKFVAPTFGCFQNRNTPLLGTVGDPALKLLGDLAQYITAHRGTACGRWKRTQPPVRAAEKAESAH